MLSGCRRHDRGFRAAAVAVGRALAVGAAARAPGVCDFEFRARGAVGENRAVISDDNLRPLRNLRLSVTDRCNLRCSYCMPERGLRVAAAQGHPRSSRRSSAWWTCSLARRGQGPPHRRRAAAPPRTFRTWCAGSRHSRRIRDLAMTTNGVLLADQAGALQGGGAAPGDGEPRHARAGAIPGAHPLRRARPRAGRHRRRGGGLPGVKIDTVVIRGVERRRARAAARLRPRAAPRSASSSTWTSGGATHWSTARVVSRRRDAERLAGALRAD